MYMYNCVESAEKNLLKAGRPQNCVFFVQKVGNSAELFQPTVYMYMYVKSSHCHSALQCVHWSDELPILIHARVILPKGDDQSNL